MPNLEHLHYMFENAYTEWTENQIRVLWELFEWNTKIEMMCIVLGRFPDEIALKLIDPDTAKAPVCIKQIPGFEDDGHLRFCQLQKEAMNYPSFQLRKQIQERQELIKEITKALQKNEKNIEVVLPVLKDTLL
jgi:hypothetical protein